MAKPPMPEGPSIEGLAAVAERSAAIGPLPRRQRTIMERARPMTMAFASSVRLPASKVKRG